jgi:hypothetical protein
MQLRFIYIGEMPAENALERIHLPQNALKNGNFKMRKKMLLNLFIYLKMLEKMS